MSACRICGRCLTDTDSVKAGIGPECRTRIGVAALGKTYAARRVLYVLLTDDEARQAIVGDMRVEERLLDVVLVAVAQRLHAGKAPRAAHGRFLRRCHAALSSTLPPPSPSASPRNNGTGSEDGSAAAPGDSTRGHDQDTAEVLTGGVTHGENQATIAG